jgi:hypothetical protein
VIKLVYTTRRALPAPAPIQPAAMGHGQSQQIGIGDLARIKDSLPATIGIGGAGKAGEEALLEAPQSALQLLQEREIVARTPGKGGKIEAQPANATPASLTSSGSSATTSGAEACRNQDEKCRSSERRPLLCNI